MGQWQSDAELFDSMRRELYTPVVGDILDKLGRLHQFLPPAIRPLRDDMIVVGRAMPVQQVTPSGHEAKPFGLMTEALDDLRLGEVYIATGGDVPCANWGEILTAAAKARGAVGAVVNGFHRDTPRVLEQQFPVFSRGAYAQDSAPRMKVTEFRCRIELEGIVIEPGDLVFGDRDGVVIVPNDLVDQVLTEALQKARTEKTVRRKIEEGMGATAAFDEYGVL
jgi:4-hydroxy-4-methyl-2-oxoglutarate aldolase